MIDGISTKIGSTEIFFSSIRERNDTLIRSLTTRIPSALTRVRHAIADRALFFNDSVIKTPRLTHREVLRIGGRGNGYEASKARTRTIATTNVSMLSTVFAHSTRPRVNSWLSGYHGTTNPYAA